MMNTRDRITDFYRRLFGPGFDRLDRRITSWMAGRGLLLLRLSLGLVYLWFGALKLIPNASPASELIRRSFEFLPGDFFVPMVGVLEILIGLGFATGLFLRLTILLMSVQILGSISPVMLEPSAVWQSFPFILTLEGQYMVKNSVLIAAAIVIGATVRLEAPEGNRKAPLADVAPKAGEDSG